MAGSGGRVVHSRVVGERRDMHGEREGVLTESSVPAHAGIVESFVIISSGGGCVKKKFLDQIRGAH